MSIKHVFKLVPVSSCQSIKCVFFCKCHVCVCSLFVNACGSNWSTFVSIRSAQSSFPLSQHNFKHSRSIHLFIHIFRNNKPKQQSNSNQNAKSKSASGETCLRLSGMVAGVRREPATKKSTARAPRKTRFVT